LGILLPSNLGGLLFLGSIGAATACPFQAGRRETAGL
jgi:hypothetical protein